MSEPDHPCLHEWRRAAAARMPSTWISWNRPPDGPRPTVQASYGPGGRDFIVGDFFVYGGFVVSYFGCDYGVLFGVGALSDVGPFHETGWFHFVIGSFAVCGFFAPTFGR